MAAAPHYRHCVPPTFDRSRRLAVELVLNIIEEADQISNGNKLPSHPHQEGCEALCPTAEDSDALELRDDGAVVNDADADLVGSARTPLRSARFSNVRRTTYYFDFSIRPQ